MTWYDFSDKHKGTYTIVQQLVVSMKGGKHSEYLSTTTYDVRYGNEVLDPKF